MKSLICLSLACAAILNAAEAELAPLNVEGTTLSDVSGEEVKSADLAEALTKKVPTVSLVRRSGIANDIILRGQKKDNINILIDDAKIYGACPNRMDPATSHVLTNNIESIDITEGPYDVENFGTLSGAVKITTKKPTEEIEGEISLNGGSYAYRKASATVSGGTENVKMLISASTEKSAQYKDGDGNTMAEQLKIATDGTMAAGTQYQPAHEEKDAYEKNTFMGKLFVDITDDQELQLGYTTNRSYDILYPSSKMDALYDISNIYTLDYSLKRLGAFSDNLSLSLYHTDVDHPMSNRFRKSSSPMMMGDMVSDLSTSVQGAKLKNSFDLAEMAFTVGLDASKRNWDGTYYKDGALHMTPKSINDADTQNSALFLEVEKEFSDLNVKFGARYDATSITVDSAQQDNDYTALSANLFATYKAAASTTIFAGAGKASRVPDARELYFVSSMGTAVGTPTLDQTTNYEVDLGAEQRFENAALKVKLFYSMLKDYIYYNADSAANNFENIDATIYGVDLSGSYFMSDALYVDAGIAYQRGQKDEALAGQNDKDLAEIPPLKGTLGLNYDYADSTMRAEVVAADEWMSYDADNGEQPLAGYAVLNLKVDHAFSDSFSTTFGMDNVFNHTYAVSNTYNDLTLIPAGTGEVMLLNEPGRYAYINATYRF